MTSPAIRPASDAIFSHSPGEFEPLTHGHESWVNTLITGATDLVVGLIVGAAVLALVMIGQKMFGKK